MSYDPYRQKILTDASSIPRDQLGRTQQGMAHFAGTGPDGERCGGCLHWQAIPKRATDMHCAKYRQMVGRKGPFIKVHSSNWACRHWEKR